MWTTRRLRLAGGLVLFVYVGLHLANHAAMAISLAAAEEYARVMFAIVRTWPVQAVLYAALGSHFALALAAIYARRDFGAISRGEAAQLVAGLLIVPLMAGHVVPARLGPALLDTTPFHTLIVLTGTRFDPLAGVLTLAGLTLAWLHGCIGVHFWLRLKPFYPRVRLVLFALAVALFVAALAGYLAGAREANALYDDPAWRASMDTRYRLADASGAALLERIRHAIYLFWAFAIAGTFAARRLRVWAEHRAGRFAVAYPDGRIVVQPRGASILDASRAGHVPHAAVCGGRGRCSTCRVRVERGMENLDAAAPAELAVLARVGAPPGVRLACQARPTGDVAIVPLLPANAGPQAAGRLWRDAAGSEKTIAVMFADLRGFTALSETKLPYDVVFLLNRYFAEMGAAIEAAGGRLDKFVGDGIVALFGVESGPAAGTRAAIAAAKAMIVRLEALNRALAHDLKAPLRIGIGIHTGPAIVGEMGYAQARQFTAIGDTVNTASRLEALTKEFGAEVLVSADAAAASALDLGLHMIHTIDIRGRRGTLDVHVVADARTLPDA
ncbi:MAG: 2Fe-2S iron-sulfur cluster binding domain-containing protein [Alphaproteobacteria bacterium]|nr:2Fe-2S iron-sulfur cluster binding domain-containing protein [Alphaproteobacteria bacterium]